MARKSFEVLLLALIAILIDVQAVHDPTYTGIKTKTYRRDPAYDRQQQQQQQHHEAAEAPLYNANNNYQVDSGHERLSAQAPRYVQQQQQQQGDHQGASTYQREIPLYERQTTAGGWSDAENSITEYYTGCPTQFTGQLPYAYDCRRFLNCWNGRGHIQTCAPGTAFNAQTSECDRRDKVVCNALGMLGSQPGGQEDNRNGRLVEVDSTDTTILLCPSGVTGLQPHPTDCTKFLNCANGHAHIQQCGPGTAYSIPLMVCDYRHKVDCGQRPYAAVEALTEQHVEPARRIVATEHQRPPVTPLAAPTPQHHHQRQPPIGCKGHVPSPILKGSGTAPSCTHGPRDEGFHRVLVSNLCRFPGSPTNCMRPTGTAPASDSRVHSKGSAEGLLCPNSVSGYFAYPFDYTKFFNCRQGNTAIQSCVANTRFSISKGYCDTKDKLEQGDHVLYIVSEVSYEYSKMVTECPPDTDGSHLYPFDGRKYVQCQAGQMSIQTCQPASVFSISRRICFAESLVPDYDRVQTLSEYNSTSGAQQQTRFLDGEHIVCPAQLAGSYPYPFDANKYLDCQRGQLTIASCAPGSAYSLSSKHCQLKEDTPRTDRVLFVEEYLQQWSVAMYLSYFSESLTYLGCPPKFNGTFVYPFDCTKFIRCRAGVTLVEECKPNEVLSISRRRCVARGQVEAFDRVDYLTSTQHEFSRELEHQHELELGLDTEDRQRKQDTAAGVGFITEDHNNRGSKSYGENIYRENGHREQVQQSGGTYGHRDRWSNMNMQRPSATGSGHPSWTGSSTYHPVGNQHVLLEEGSLQPDRNYVQQTLYSTPLAPMLPTGTSTSTNAATNTGTGAGTQGIYYAQPLGSQEDSREAFVRTPSLQMLPPPPPPPQPSTFTSALPSAPVYVHRQNYSGEISPYNPRETSWSPSNTRSHTHAHAITVPNQQLMPPYQEGDSPIAVPRPSVYPSEQVRIPKGPTAVEVPTTHLMPPHRDSSAPYAAPSSTLTNTHAHPPHRRPLVEAPVTHLMPPLPNRDEDIDDGQRPQTEFGLDGNYPHARAHDQYPSSSHRQNIIQLESSNLYGAAQPYETSTALPPRSRYLTSTPDTPRRVISAPVADESNLFGGLQPPLPTPVVVAEPTPATNSNILQLHPSLENASTVKNHIMPHYSSPYSGVAHSRNSSWTGIKGGRSHPSSTTTDYYGVGAPDYGHSYLESTTPATQSLEPLTNAMRLLLRPYFNRSGSVDDLAQGNAESHIMQVITKTPHRPQPAHETHEDDIESILAGEQKHLLDSGRPTHRAPHHGITEYHSNLDTITPPIVEEPTISPSSPTPNADDEESAQLKHRHHHHHPHHHQHHPDHNHRHPHAHPPFHPHKHLQHNKKFHEMHPHMPNPFAETPKQVEPKNNENPSVETTNPYDIDIRSFHPDSDPKPLPPRPNACQFDCGNGKCVKEFEVCDGVNNCGNRKDESRCDHLGYELRLAGGEQVNSGRIEVKVLGKWGYVCDDKFGLRDADVACHELGFHLGASEVRGNSFYAPPEANITYAMDEVECRGNETSLKECDFKGWGINNCGPDEVVGVVCKVPLFKCPNNYWLCSTSKECIPPAFVCDHTPDCEDKSDESDRVCNSPVVYRLEGGRTANEGRLEVMYHGEWGSVCDDDFGLTEAQVACNSLGFYGMPSIRKNIFGPGNGPIWLDQVSCFGNETAIHECSHWTWGEHNCNHTEDVGLKCVAGPPPRKIPTNTSSRDARTDEEDPDNGQSILEDVGLYPGQWERSSKQTNPQRRCGTFKSDVRDEYDHPEERVVNGTIAKRGRYPWQATIRTRGRGGISSHWCGAVLISKRHLLTAAHCLAGYPKGAYFIRLGDHYANIAESSEIDSYIENWYIHEKFRDKTHMNNDIALVVLKTPVKFNDYVQPICLPEKGAPLQENRLCTISGWGSIKSGVSTPSNILRAAQVPLLSDATCKQAHVYGASMTEGMFCAGSMDESVDACDGDSGGPLICSDDSGETLYGIISWGQHCGYINKPGVYVRVEKYIDWIYEKINYSLHQTRPNL